MFCYQSSFRTWLSLDLHEDWLNQSAMLKVWLVGDLHMGTRDSYTDILTVSAASSAVDPSADLLLYRMTVDDSAIHIGTSISTFATSGHTDSSSPHPLLLNHIILLISLSFTLDNQRNDSQLSPSLSLQPPSPDLIQSHPLSHLYRYMS
jgi:hypothetical protein